MKKSLLFGIAALALTVGACGGNEKKASPEEEVRDYGRYFVEKLAANQVDSIKATYPDIVKGDSLLPVKSDTIIVVESAPGKFDVTLAEGIILKVNRSEEGDITVAESKGLFVFPDDKVELAKKTGMWDDNLTDAQLAERMNDNDFFEWVKAKIKKTTSNILSVKGDVFSGDGQYIVNNTNVHISGSDYVILKEETMRYETDEMYVWDWKTRKYSKPGRDIPPHGKIKEESWVAPVGTQDVVKGVKMKLSQEQMLEKFASFTGQEYQEYLDSKKN